MGISRFFYSKSRCLPEIFKDRKYDSLMHGDLLRNTNAMDVFEYLPFY
jgi:hypothetical protein